MSGTCVKERPILFSGPMVRALLDGRKTQTRRVVKVQPIKIERHESFQRAGTVAMHFFGEMRHVACPYGSVGGRLWVRESLHAVNDTKIDDAEKMPIAAYSADGSHIWTKGKFRKPWDWQRKSLPSIHMPRRLARITLEITDVRVQRLNEIGEEDCEAEGPTRVDAGQFGMETWKSAYRNLWIDINGPGSWEQNPWVWAITFNRVDEAGR